MWTDDGENIIKRLAGETTGGLRLAGRKSNQVPDMLRHAARRQE